MPRVKLFANLRKIAGVKEISIEGASIGAILSGLVKQHPALEAHLVENGKIRPHVLITVNGQINLDAQTPVTEEDEIAIFPPIAGG
jgi:molybdopterin synthase sulfur carrier subunit